MLEMHHCAMLLLAVCMLSRASATPQRQHVADPENAFNGLRSGGVDGSAGSLHSFREGTLGLTLFNDIEKGHRVPPTQYHDVVFVVQQKNMDILTRLLLDVSDPSSEKYGNHLSKEEIDDLTYNGDSHQIVMAYLNSVGAEVVLVECSGELIRARAQISLWETILDTEFHHFSHKNSMDGIDAANDETGTLDERTFIRTEKYSVPISLDDHVAFVLNTVQIPPPKSRRYSSADMGSYGPAKSSSFSQSSLYTEGHISPQLINDAYNIDDNTGHPRATQAAMQGLGQIFSPDDLRTFQTYYQVPILAVNRSQENMTRPSEWCATNLDLCAESNLDLMYMLAVANTPTYHSYFRSNSMAEWFLNLAHSKNPPLVLSLSYGADENRITQGEALIMQNAAIRLGTRGVTIVVAAGDDGVTSPYARSNPTQCAYIPSWPASCPYITSIGATQVRSILITRMESMTYYNTQKIGQLLLLSHKSQQFLHVH